MRTHLMRLLTLCFLVVPRPAVVAAGSDDGAIARLVRQLGDEDFDKREEASTALKKVGRPALEALRKAATESSDAEVRARAAGLVRAIRDALNRPVDLGPHVNQRLNEPFHNHYPGNDLAALPSGRQTFADVAFTVGGGVVQLGKGMPEKVEGIRVDARALKLHFLHACGRSAGTPANTVVGKYVVHYDGGLTEEIEIVYGKDVVDWWVQPGVADPTRGKVAWEGQNGFSRIKLFVTTWDNPHPQKRITALDFVATRAAPFCVAISAEN